MTFTPWECALLTRETAAAESTGSSTMTFAPWAMAELNCCCCLSTLESALL